LNLDFEAQLWAAADKMRGHMDASESKHICLGLIFLKYISDAFKEKREQLLFGFSDPKSEWFIKDEPQRVDVAENRDEYLAANVFWLPPEARWHTIKAKSPEIGKVIDDAMGAIERENPTLKGCCRAITPGPASTLQRATARIVSAKAIGRTFAERKTMSGLADSWTSSATSASTNPRRSPRTSSGASKNTRSSPARKGLCSRPNQVAAIGEKVTVRRHHHLENGADESPHSRH
jgi:hypothetical protein